ncbi:MAG: hypothetical protein KIS79_08555 [Burkholderiales bacterium]|nr:hypothetical protein [Burkholderiales bacterium]
MPRRIVLVLTLFALATPVLADNSQQSKDATQADKPLTAQQQKMRDCNVEAKSKSLKGDERKKFMSTCLSKS